MSYDTFLIKEKNFYKRLAKVPHLAWKLKFGFEKPILKLTIVYKINNWRAVSLSLCQLIAKDALLGPTPLWKCKYTCTHTHIYQMDLKMAKQIQKISKC